MPIPYLPAPDAYLARLGARELGLGGWFTQHARLITLDTPQASGLPDTLVVERFHGREGVNELFCFDIEALSLSTHRKRPAVPPVFIVTLAPPCGFHRRAAHEYEIVGGKSPLLAAARRGLAA